MPRGRLRRAAGDPAAGPIAGLDTTARFHWLVAPSSTIIQPSVVHTGLCGPPADELDELFRELVVVPHARIQYVDVQAGPLVRKFGLAGVQLHTASASTDASIPGLPAAEAAELRDQLARLGETRSVGL